MTVKTVQNIKDLKKKNDWKRGRTRSVISTFGVMNDIRFFLFFLSGTQQTDHDYEFVVVDSELPY